MFNTQAIAKLWLFFKHHHLLRPLYDFGLQIFDDSRVPKNGKYYRILEIGSDNHVSLIKTNLLVLSTAVALYSVYPFYAFIRGERPDFIMVYLVGVNRGSVEGYTINTAFQLLISTAGLLLIIVVDMFLTALISVYSMSIELVSYHCKNLNELTESNAETSEYRRIYLRNIIMQISDIDM